VHEPTQARVAIMAVCGLLPAEAESLAAWDEIVPGPLEEAIRHIWKSRASKLRTGCPSQYRRTASPNPALFMRFIENP
jgi:hypothetical protein